MLTAFLELERNSPSHLDWTKPTVGVLPNHRYVVEWPVTKFIQEKGLIDEKGRFARHLRYENGKVSWRSAACS